MMRRQIPMHRQRLRTLFILVTFVVGVARVAEAQVADAASSDSTKMALIARLLDRTHAAEQGVTGMETAVAAQRNVNPRIPGVFWDRLVALARTRQTELGQLIAVVYDRHFTTQEIGQILAFYETPLGAKLLQAQPAILQESMQAGQEWGRRLGAEVGAQLNAEGVRVSP